MTKSKKSRARTQAEIKQQIVDRVKPVRQSNVVKKRYLPGSPGAARAKLGITLTFLKAAINEPCARVTVMLNDLDQPTGESMTEMVRDTHACTLRRRNYTKRGLLGHTKFMRRAELKALAVARKQRRKNPVSMSMVASKADLAKAKKRA